MEYGLIGTRLSQSFSKEIHEKISDYEYELCEISEESFDSFMKNKDFKGINVTMPFKEKVIGYLDYIDPEAMETGAVNTVINKDSRLYGYNTDYFGLSDTLKANNIVLQDSRVMILGSGGTSKTARAVCKKSGAEKIITVSRRPKENEISYGDINEYSESVDFIINTTPVGMYPDINSVPVGISAFKNLKGVIDVIYNPIRSGLLIDSLDLGIKAVGGLYMLISQAIYSSLLFRNKDFESTDITKTVSMMIRDKENIVLIGMPSCGKTTLGKMIAEYTRKRFIDTDLLIEERVSMKCGEFIEKYGENEFRKIENETVKEISGVFSSVIATGGGTLLNKENADLFRMNGKTIFIDRPLSLLKSGSERPLSNSSSKLEKIYNDRIGIYKKYADSTVISDSDIKTSFERILEVL